MVHLSQIKLRFGHQMVFDGASWSIYAGQRVGLVGPNGSGKSTILRMLCGEIAPDDGQVIIPQGVSTGYLPQNMDDFNTDRTLMKEVMNVFGHLVEAEREMRELEHEISVNHTPEHMKRYDQLQELFIREDGFTMEARAKAVLTGLGFSEENLTRPVRIFSGGWRMRIALAKLLLRHPSLLLLDEPTNHLDMETLIWLEKFIADYSGTLVIVSHDRYFLDRITDHIAEIYDGKVRVYPGNYSDYEEARAQRLMQQEAEQKNQERQIDQIERFIERFRYKASKASQVQSRIKYLKKIQRTDVEKLGKSIGFQFPKPPRSGDPVIAFEHVMFDYGGGPVFTDATFQIRREEKVALLGPNGAGKSTLMKIISRELDPGRGKARWGYNLEMAYFAQHQLDQLNPELNVLDEVWSQVPGMQQSTIRGLLGQFLFSGDDVFKPVSVLSGGEKSRIVLLKMLLKNANFLILDEPTNHLDMQSKEVLAQALDEFPGSVLIVSHDRFFLDMLVTKVLWFQEGYVKEYPGNYSEFQQWYDEKFNSGVQDTKNTDSKPEKMDSKTRRRIEAQERQKKSREKKKYREKLDKTEQKIDALQKEKSDIEHQMNGTGFSTLTPDEMAAITRRYQSVVKALEELEYEWLLLTEKMELVT
jgi:ATP-binding cassette, subfamily F, member 3